MKIVVYGLGRVGRNFLSNLENLKEQMDIEIVAVSDGNSEVWMDETIRQLFVFSNELKAIKCDYVVITSTKYFDEIKTYLIDRIKLDPAIIISEEKLFSIGNANFECNMCRSEFSFWKRVGLDMSSVIHKNIVGAGMRYGRCPRCNCTDRTRYVYEVLKKYTDILSAKCSVLHFASEITLKNKLIENQECCYLSADIMEGRCDVVADITDMQFENDSFDYIICNHVLEHVDKLSLAFAELHRVIKANGKIIITVPVCWEIETYENDDIVTKEERFIHFGQEDHVRLFGHDVVRIMEEKGFRVSQYKCKECCTEEEIKKYKLIPEDCVFILMKK